jgi:hypothetical protein
MLSSWWIYSVQHILLYAELGCQLNCYLLIQADYSPLGLEVTNDRWNYRGVIQEFRPIPEIASIVQEN